MRILTFAPNYLPATRYGGPIQSSHGLARALVARGHEVHVLTTNVDGPGVLDVPIGEIVHIDGVKVRYFPVTAPRRLYFAPGMGHVLDRETASFDVVHINGMYLWPGPRAARSARRCGVPHVVSPRGMLVPEMIAGKSALAKRAWIALFERASLASAAAIHVTSEEERAGLERLGLEFAHVAVIGNGVERPAEMVPAGDIARLWSGIPEGSRVVFLGRLDWTKGVDLAIAAVLAQPQAQILIAGVDQTGLKARLEPLLAAARASGSGTARGRFIGEVTGADKWALLAGADVLLAPSLKESFGMSVAEALAVGTPVICTEGVGAAAIVRRIDAGLVVQRSSGAIAGALAALLADRGRRARFGARAREIMAQEYTWDAIARDMEGVYVAAHGVAASGRRAA